MWLSCIVWVVGTRGATALCRAASVALAVSLVGLCLTFPRTSAAQPAEPEPAGEPAEPSASESPPEDADALRKQQAKERFKKGIDFVAAEDWDAALAEFEASLELFPTKVALKNAATSLRQLKRYVEALDAYEELVRKYEDKLTPDERKIAAEAMAKLRNSVGEIVVESDQGQSSVVVDGLDRGVTPLMSPIRVKAGTHTVRVSKSGFESFETRVRVAGGQRKTVRATLRGLTRSGRLRVTEATGKQLEVVIDGATVGKTPWEGTLSVGTHTVYLRGENDLGTPPSVATVFANKMSNLSLKAGVLDAELRVEPSPSNARIDIDGVQVGNGVWQGRLKSGQHKVEVTAKGFLAYRKDVEVKPGRREVITVSLRRDLTDPMWRERSFAPHVYLGAVGGGAFSTSFGGSADAACKRGECGDRDRPTGFFAGARAGYQLTSGLGLELFVGYMQLKEEMVRRVEAAHEPYVQYLVSTDYRDQTKLAGPLAAASASYQFLERTPILARLWVGAWRAQASFENEGRFDGYLVSTEKYNYVDDDGTVSQVNLKGTFELDVSIPERSENIWIPFVGPELRFGYRFSDSFAMDVGVAAFVMFPPEVKRTDTEERDPRFAGFASDNPQVQDQFYPDLLPDGQQQIQAPGAVKLPNESGFGTFFVILPTLGGRFDF